MVDIKDQKRIVAGDVSFLTYIPVGRGDGKSVERTFDPVSGSPVAYFQRCLVQADSCFILSITDVVENLDKRLVTLTIPETSEKSCFYHII